MKAILLAAGMGKRLQPLTDKIPKPLLPVGDKSLIEHHLYRLSSLGVTDIVINLRHLGHMIKEALGAGDRYGVRIAYSEETQLLETGGGIKNALPLLGEDPFLVVSSDTYIEYDDQLPNYELASESLGCLLMVDNPEHHEQGDFSLQDGRLGYSGPKRTYSGTSILTPDLVRGVADDSFTLRTVFDTAIDQGRLEGLYYPDYWCDVGTEARYRNLLETLSLQSDP